ncbi:MAG: tetratricopeptide repeat protein [Acidobacteriia bacterium]|nr:tetratricopeptide repeat protein [Terriglobia bacterium]
MENRAKRHLALFMACTVLIMAGMTLPAQTRKVPAAARNHYLRAQDYLKQNQREKAVAELKTAIQLAPEFIEAHNDYIANQQAKSDRMVAEYEGYLKQHPQSAAYHYLAGKAYAKAGRTKDRDAEYQKSLDLSPGFSWALIELGATALDNQDKLKAAELFEKARAKAGDSPKLHMALASRLNSVQKYDSALAEVQRVLQLDPNSFDAYPTLWRTKLRHTWGAEKTQAEVMQEIKNLESRYSRNPKALDAVARGYAIFFADGEEERVRRAISAIDPKYFVNSGTGLRTMAMTAAGKELTFAGPDVERIDQVGWLADPKAQLAAYREIENSLKDQDLKIHVLYTREATAYMKDGDFENAERLLGLMEKGGARVTSLQMELASAFLDRKIKLDTARTFIDQGIAATRNALAQQEAAKGSAGAISGTKSLLARWLYLQGRLLAMQGALDQAVVPLKESIQLTEREAAALELGQAYAKLNRTDDAVKMLLLACSFDGSKRQDAREALERIYGDREGTKPVAAAISEAVEKRKLAIRSSGGVYIERSTLEGKAAPPFELADVTGQKVNLSDYQGKVILLNFWATW